MKQKFFKNHSITLKALLIAALVLLMLIPVSMVKSLVKERENNKEAVQKDIASKWGGKQQVTGPVLVLPYYKDGNEKSPISYAYFLPEEYNVTGKIEPEIRSRNIYHILCYRADMHINGIFHYPDYEKLSLDKENILWKDAFFLIGIPYLQGIKNKVIFNINGVSQEILASVTGNDLIDSGLTVKIPLDKYEEKEAFKFDFDLVLNGSDGLYFIPIGKQTDIHMESTYNLVTFDGDFLPNNRQVGQEGFDAAWNIFDYNRNYAQMWKGANYEINNSGMGVQLLLPVDEYQKNMRSAKYAILFIALTFLVFFMVELTGKKRIHPIQYALVSFALVLYYCLLLAFSEHVGFNISYLISSVAIITLITAYSHTIFRVKKQTLYMGAFLSFLYIFLYVVIQLENMALLLGSIGLFAALAIVMYVSRKIDWYKNEKNVRDEISSEK